MKFKKGTTVLSNNLIGTIIAVMVVIVLLILLFKIFTPSFDRGDKIAESYFESLDKAIETAKSGKIGNFFMIDDGDKKLEFYLVYFGDISNFREGGKNFVRSEQGENVICVCCRNDESVVCNYCKDLKLPASYYEKEKSSSWIIKEGERITIKKEKYYEFARI